MLFWVLLISWYRAQYARTGATEMESGKSKRACLSKLAAWHVILSSHNQMAVCLYLRRWRGQCVAARTYMKC